MVQNNLKYTETIPDSEIFQDTELTKDKSRGTRRKKDYAKAIRKMKLSMQSWNEYRGWYGSNIHRYSKNKIHCSCPMCKEKTNASYQKGKGKTSDNQLCHYPNGETGSLIPIHWGVTNKRYGKKNYKVSDRKVIDSCIIKEQEYEKYNE